MESNASEGVLHEQCDPEGEFVPTYSLFLQLQFAIECDLVSVVICILLGSEWMTCFQLYQTSNNKQLLNFLCVKMKLPLEFMGCYWLFMVKIL